MDIFATMQSHDHEQLVFGVEPGSGYRGLIAIHNTALGPALGGTRYWRYASEDDAVIDALRLAKGMTYKAAVAGLALGGGKSVIMMPDGPVDREGLFRAHGRMVEAFKGRYITAEDVGTSPADMDYIHLETDHVVGLQGRSGDPSPVTAHGVYMGMKASAKWKFGSDDLSGRTVAVQGCGHVGYYLCQYLSAEGAKLLVTDIAKEKVDRVVAEFGAKAVKPEAIYGQEADIFAPCALGAVINDQTLPQLKVQIIAGGANNVLAEPRHGDALQQQQILYAPDYVINAGGLINVNSELMGWSAERAHRKAGEIYDTMLRVFQLAKDEGLPTYQAADRVAEKRIAMAARLKRTWL
ncbi:MAG: leucine dehydrogenase [Gemmatimonadetes bacterium GWC2_71_10]|nr:MAG: leucine dehydrogenase [Gemmatimonadetes bacterium GWC2_71_10]